MTEQVPPASGAQAGVPDSKWVKGISAEQAAAKAAELVLSTRFYAVAYWLPLAAERSGDEPEYVHQLRVSSRRAAAALRVFSEFLSQECYAVMKALLRDIRRAADAARNWDVLGERLGNSGQIEDDATRGCLKRRIQAERDEAQRSIAQIHHALAGGRFQQGAHEVLAEIAACKAKKAADPFGRRARRYLERSVKKAVRAAQGDLSSDGSLHQLRIRLKKLRYSMEIVAPAFEPAFRKQLYPQIVRIQDWLGAVNDHVTAKSLFRLWLDCAKDDQETSFCERLIGDEERLLENARQAFLKACTPDAVAELKRGFRKHCDHAG